jgi:hypothetical protein
MKTPTQVADDLTRIYNWEFGGKDRGRFRISRRQLRRLSGRGRLEDSILSQFVQHCYERGLVVTDLGDEFSVIEVAAMQNYRKAPSRLIEECARE